MSGFHKLLQHAAGQVNTALDALLAVPDGHEGRLYEAMRYTVLADGKGFRPFYVWQLRKFSTHRNLPPFGWQARLSVFIAIR